MSLHEKEAHGADVEKGHYDNGLETVDSGNAVRAEAFDAQPGLRGKLLRLAGKFGVEQRGIERVPEEERTDTKPYLHVATMWLAANMVVSSFAIGVLGPNVFYTGTADGALTVLFFNFIGVLPVCFFSTFGCKFGLRQMVLSRFWYGYYGVKLIAVFNVLACIGWSSVNAIVGAQLINATNNNVPGAVGIVIIAICTFFVCLFGYKVVHSYEMYSWFPLFIIFLIVIGIFGHSGDYQKLEWGTGTAEMGSVLSFGAVVFGFAVGWCSYAADYTCYQPSGTNRIGVFFATMLGLLFPLIFCETLGVVIGSAVRMNDGDNIYATGYHESGIGGLLAAVLVPHVGGFGKFCLVILALSIIGNNIPNIYSVALTMQVLARWTARVPRFVWTFLGTCAYIAIAIPGYTHFEQVLENFMDLIGYWLAIYCGIGLTEHFLFRKGTKGYNAEDYETPNKLPVGIAAISAFCFGVAGMVVGMSQVWWVGPIALHAGMAPFGGDVGFELAFAFAATTYAVFRTIEKRIFPGR